MSTLAPSKRANPTNTYPGDPGLCAWFTRMVLSTVGGKFVVALTGAALTLFVVIHMIGNLQIFAGQNAINNYAEALKSFGALLWVARLGLLSFFLIHIFLAVRLKLRSKEARPVPYAHENTIQASLASRTMVQTGLVILVFVLYHLAHFTFGWLHGAEIRPGVTVNYLDLRDAAGRHDVYSMMVFGFRNAGISIIYIIAQLVILMHLGHGVASVFQSLGFNHPRWQPWIRNFGCTVALIVVVGNLLIVCGAWFGFLPPQFDLVKTLQAAGR